MEEIVNLITNVGFPIACCVVLFVQNNKLEQTLNQMNLSLRLLYERMGVKDD